MLTCFHRVNVTFSHQTPPHCLGPGLEVRALALHTAGEAGKCWVQAEGHGCP